VVSIISCGVKTSPKLLLAELKMWGWGYYGNDIEFVQMETL